MSKIRFRKDLDGNLVCWASVQTRQGIRQAIGTTSEIPPKDAMHPGTFRKAVKNLFASVESVQDGASKRKVAT